jgi:hypothetical protein
MTVPAVSSGPAVVIIWGIYWSGACAIQLCQIGVVEIIGKLSQRLCPIPCGIGDSPATIYIYIHIHVQSAPKLFRPAELVDADLERMRGELADMERSGG